MNTTKEKAQEWAHPEILKNFEQERRLVSRALGTIVSDVFREHVPVGEPTIEIGAGRGYLKEYIPPDYHQLYYTTEYHPQLLKDGLKERNLQSVAASVYELPFQDLSARCVIDIDAVDTLHNLNGAMSEVR